MKGPDCLDQTARDIIAEGRYAIEPSTAVRDRVRAQVLLRVGAATATLLGTRSLLAVVGKWTAVSVIFGAALSGILYWSRAPGRTAVGEVAQAAEPVTERVAATSASAASAETAPVDDATIKVPPNTEQAAQRAANAMPSVQPRTSDLAAEIELLAQVNAALYRGNSRRARQLLGDYDRRFPGGVLREERSAAEILALCATGDLGHARAAVARFEKRWPRSPLRVRIEASCAATR